AGEARVGIARGIDVGDQRGRAAAGFGGGGVEGRPEFRLKRHRAVMAGDGEGALLQRHSRSLSRSRSWAARSRAAFSARAFSVAFSPLVRPNLTRFSAASCSSPSRFFFLRAARRLTIS